MSQSGKFSAEQKNDTLPGMTVESSDTTQTPQSLQEEISMNRELLEETLEEARKMQAQGKSTTKMVIICKALERVIYEAEQELKQRTDPRVF